MARVFIEGFDGYGRNVTSIPTNLTQWDAGDDLYTDTQSSSYGGGYYAYGQIYKKVISSMSTIYVSIYMYLTSSSTVNLISLYSSSAIIAGIKRNGTSKNIEVYRGNYANLLSTGSATISENTWYQIEFAYHPHSSTGTFQIKIDGSEAYDVDYSGNTATSATTVEGIGLVISSIGGRYDHLVIDNASWIGNSRIQSLSVSSDVSCDWHRSTGGTDGTNYSCINEDPYSITNYVEVNTNNITDRYTCSDLSGSVASIRSVQVQAMTMRLGASTPTHLKVGVKTEGEEYYSGNNVVPTGDGVSFVKLYEDNPKTETTWTSDEVNAMELAIQSVA